MTNHPGHASFTPVKAHFVPSQQRGRDVAVYIFPDDHELCYEWFCQLQLVDGHTFLYMCCGCKSLKSRDPRKYSRPVASCRIVDGFFITDPRKPKRPHFCEPRLTTKATARRLIIGKCNELRDGGGSRPAAQELDELLARISSEEFGGFSAEERATMINQIVCKSEYGRDNARRIIQRAQQRARQGVIPSVTTDSHDTSPEILHGKSVIDEKLQRPPGVEPYLCLVCGKYRELSRSQIPSFNRHHVLVLLSAMIYYKNMRADFAKEVYNGCFENQRIICKEHYVEAAAPLLSRMVPTTDNIPFDTNLNALHMSEEMVTQNVLVSLNEKASMFQDKEGLTAYDVTSFLNETIASFIFEKKKTRKRGERRVGTTGCLKTVKSGKQTRTEQINPSLQNESTAESLPEKEPSTLLECLPASTAADESEEIVVDDERPHDSNDVVESLLLFSGSVNRDEEQPLPSSESGLPNNTPITAKKMMETMSLTPMTLPPTWLDKVFVVEGRQLLELFRFCPLCGTDMEASGSSLQCSAEGDNPVVDVHCRSCMEKRGNIARWKGRLQNL